MKKAVLAIGIALWSLLGLVILTFLIAWLSGASAPGWVRSLPGYGSLWKGENSMVVFGGSITLIKEDSYAVAGVGNLSVTGTYQSVYVTLNDGDKLTVRHYDYDTAEGFGAEYVNGGLAVYTHKRTMINVFGFNVSNWPRLEISVPRSYAENISFTASSGSVQIEDNAVWGDTSLRSTSGSVRVKGTLSCDALQVSTTSGSVHLEFDVESGDTLLKSTSGSVKVSGRLSCGDLQVSTTSGSIRLYAEVTGRTAEISSTSGGVHIDRAVRCDRLTVRTTSGGITLADCDVSGSVTLKSVSGRIQTGDVRGADITSGSTSGGQTLGALDADGMISLTAVSGKIQADAVRSPQHHIKTTSGSIRIGELTGTGDVKSTSGSVRTG